MLFALDARADDEERGAHCREACPPRTRASQRQHHDRRTQGGAGRPGRMQPAHVSDAAVQRDVRVHAGVDQAGAGAGQDAHHGNQPPLWREGDAKPRRGAEGAACLEQICGAKPASERSAAGAGQKVRECEGRQHEAEARQWCIEGGAHVWPGDADGPRREPKRHEGNKRDARPDPWIGAWPPKLDAVAHAEDYDSSS